VICLNQRTIRERVLCIRVVMVTSFWSTSPSRPHAYRIEARQDVTAITARRFALNDAIFS
jgi:hypothetical protein